jgi:hypothetical protein
MALMFDEGRGRVITEISIWLTQSDEVLQAAGALVIGNCARTNESCQKLFEIGIVDELLSLIRKLPTNFVEQQNVSKQQVAFAVLSALRNFSIPVSLKSQMVSHGTIAVAMTFLWSTDPSVQFKSVAILRLLVAGQREVACQIVETEGVLSQIVELSGSYIHSGVKMESGRLIAAIVKHCQRKDIMQTLTECGGVVCLVRLGQSGHSIMIHEAVVALTTMVVFLGKSTVWMESEVIPMALCVAENKDLKSEMRANALNLIWHISQLGEEAVKELEQRGFANVIHQLSDESEELFQDALQKLNLLHLT